MREGGSEVKAITIWQPWASLIACGAKQFETRSWPTKYRGPIAIHAAKKPFDTDCYLDRELHVFASALGLPDIYSFEKLPYGAVIATAELVGCHRILNNGSGKKLSAYLQRANYAREYIQGNELLFGDWTPGRYAWELQDVKLLATPIPAKGKQGLWNWEDREG